MPFTGYKIMIAPAGRFPPPGKRTGLNPAFGREDVELFGDTVVRESVVFVYRVSVARSPFCNMNTTNLHQLVCFEN